MKKQLLALLATGTLLGLGGLALAQTAPKAANLDPLVTDQAAGADAAADPRLMTDSQAAAQPALKFKIKGVNADDDGNGEGGENGKGDGGHHGEGHGEAEDDNG